MAAKLKAADAAKAKGVAAADLKRVVKDIIRLGNNARENSGLAGQATKQAIDQYALDRAALNLACKLSRQEVPKAQATLRHIMEYCDKLELFATIDMFDDIIPTLEGIIERARAKEGKKEAPEPAAKSLLGALTGSPQH